MLPVLAQDEPSSKESAKDVPAVAEKTPAETRRAKPVANATVTATLMVQHIHGEPASGNPGLEVYCTTQAILLASPEIKRRTVSTMKDMDSEFDGQARIKAKWVPKTTLLEVTIDNLDSEQGTAFLETLLEEFTTFKREISQTVADRRINLITEQVISLEGRLNDDGEALQSLRQEYHMSSLRTEGEQVTQEIANLLKERQKVALEKNADTKLPQVEKRLAKKTERMREIEAIVANDNGLSSRIGRTRAAIETSLSRLTQEETRAAFMGDGVTVIIPPSSRP